MPTATGRADSRQPHCHMRTTALDLQTHHPCLIKRGEKQTDSNRGHPTIPPTSAHHCQGPPKQGKSEKMAPARGAQGSIMRCNVAAWRGFWDRHTKDTRLTFSLWNAQALQKVENLIFSVRFFFF